MNLEQGPKPEEIEAEGQTYSVSKRKNLSSTLQTAARDAAFNRVDYKVHVNIEGEPEETILVDQEKAKKILGDDAYEHHRSTGEK